jgi:hypothetical protein
MNHADEEALPNDSASKSPKVVYTVGEIFPDGSIIELASTMDDRALGLLLWKDQQLHLAQKIDHNGRRYLPLLLRDSVQQRIRFPRSATNFGTSTELLEKTSNLFETYVGLSPDQIPIATAWVISTWFPECWWRGPDLAITGLNMDLAVTLLRLLACLCRHPLMLTGVERASLHSLPMQIHPTLLINQPDISPQLLDFFRNSNYRDIVVPGPGGHVYPLAGSKAIFLGTNAVENICFKIPLPAVQRCSSALTDLKCRKIASEFQPQLLMYRLRYFSKLCAQIMSSTSGLGSSQLVPLQACIQGDTKFSARVAGMVNSREQEARANWGRKPEVAMVEVLWAPSHDSRALKVKEITKYVNTLIRTRGATFEYNEIEIGLLLASLGFPRHRNGGGMVLRFSREICKRLHELALDFGLEVCKVQGCGMCSAV